MDLGGDVILPGAFSQAKTTPDGQIRIALYHNLRQLAGKAKFSQDQHGLRYTTPPARRAPLAPSPARQPLPEPRATAKSLIARSEAAQDSDVLAQLLPKLVAASRTDDWWTLDYVNSDGVPEQVLVRVLSVGAGVATLVKRAAGRFAVPTRRILAIRPAD